MNQPLVVAGAANARELSTIDEAFIVVDKTLPTAHAHQVAKTWLVLRRIMIMSLRTSERPAPRRLLLYIICKCRHEPKFSIMLINIYFSENDRRTSKLKGGTRGEGEAARTHERRRGDNHHDAEWFFLYLNVSIFSLLV